MIKLESISLQRGPRVLLQQASMTIHQGDKVALVGGNGTGKSSLFALLKGELPIDTGELHIAKDWRVSWLDQEVTDLERQALEYVIDGDRHLRKLEANLAAAEASHDDHALAKAHGALEEYGGYNVAHKAENILAGLGFSVEQMQQPTGSFSGGWRMRISLARALFCPSDLLLLDEPTNHLDLGALLWLERWLQDYQGTILFIAHDHAFMDAIASHVAAIYQGTLNCFRGNYSSYLRQRAEQEAQQQATFDKQEAKRAHLQKFVDRFRAQATKAKQAQSRIKALERLTANAPAHAESGISFSLPANDKHSDPTLIIDQSDLGYDANAPVLKGVDMSLRPQTRIGLIGPNGAGKSTLMRTLLRQEHLLAGEITKGAHCNISYFAQHQLEELDSKATPLVILQRSFPKEHEQILRDALGKFGFDKDKSETPLETLSGGERARVAFAQISLQKPNLLLLDEPTNHLDLQARQALSEALLSYEGALVLISHDRHLIEDSTDELWLANDGKVKRFDGDLADYQKLLNDSQKNSKSATEGDSNKPVVDKKAQRQAAAAKRAELKPLKNKALKLEKQLDKLQTQLADIEEQLADSDIYEAQNADKLQQLLKKQGAMKSELDDIEMQWMEALEELEAAEAE